MLGHRKSWSVLAYASQMLTKSSSEASPSFTDLEMGASAAGYAVHEIFRHTFKMFSDSKGAFRTWYLGERIDAFKGGATTFIFIFIFIHPVSLQLLHSSGSGKIRK